MASTYETDTQPAVSSLVGGIVQDAKQLLVEQKVPQVDIFSKNVEGKWMIESYFGLDLVVELRSLNVKIPMAGIYEWVEFGVSS